MDQLIELVKGFEVQPVAILDIALTALLIYFLFSLIRGTRAVRLVIGVTVLYVIYVVAQALGLQLLSQILQAGAVVGLLALVVVFQPELRRAPRAHRPCRLVGLAVRARRAARRRSRWPRPWPRARPHLGAKKIGALIVIERETGLTDTAERASCSTPSCPPELLETLFTPHAPLHDGAVIIRHERIIAAGVILPLSESGAYRSRLGTRHRAALGITEQTDAVVVVVSEETGSISLVERGRIVRNLDQPRLAQALLDLLEHDELPDARLPERGRAAPDHARGRCARPLAHRASARANQRAKPLPARPPTPSAAGATAPARRPWPSDPAAAAAAGQTTTSGRAE